MRPPFHVRTLVEPAAGSATIQVAGELDVATAPSLTEALVAATSRPSTASVCLDLDAVTFLDVAGMRAIVLASRWARHDGWRLIVKPPRPHVRRIFQLTGADAQLEWARAESS